MSLNSLIVENAITTAATTIVIKEINTILCLLHNLKKTESEIAAIETIKALLEPSITTRPMNNAINSSKTMVEILKSFLVNIYKAMKIIAMAYALHTLFELTK